MGSMRSLQSPGASRSGSIVLGTDSAPNAALMQMMQAQQQNGVAAAAPDVSAVDATSATVFNSSPSRRPQKSGRSNSIVVPGMDADSNPATEEMRKARRQSGLVEPVALPEGATLELQPTKPPLPSPGTSAVEGLLADLDAIKAFLDGGL